jgi:hypothetical protein
MCAVLSELCSSQVLLETTQLLQRFEKCPTGAVKRALMFLKAQGYREEFRVLRQELRDCLVQLSAILSMLQFTSQVQPSAGSALSNLLNVAPFFVVHWTHDVFSFGGTLVLKLRQVGQPPRYRLAGDMFRPVGSELRQLAPIMCSNA